MKVEINPSANSGWVDVLCHIARVNHQHEITRMQCKGILVTSLALRLSWACGSGQRQHLVLQSHLVVPLERCAPNKEKSI